MSTIKISDLTSVGAVQGNVILPLVGNVAGTMTTLKGNVDQIGDYLLSSLRANVTAQQTDIYLSNVTLKSYVDGQVTAANAGVSAANVGMKGYVDTLVAAIEGGEYSNVNVAVYLPLYSGTIGSLTTANTSMKDYVDGQITAANAAVTTANVGLKGYTDQANTIQSAQITAANVGMKGYVDAQTYSNVQVATYLPTYTGNVGSITLTDLLVFGNLFVANVYVPTASNSTGVTGQITYDSSYVYICIGTDTWARANLAVW